MYDALPFVSSGGGPVSASYSTMYGASAASLPSRASLRAPAAGSVSAASALRRSSMRAGEDDAAGAGTVVAIDFSIALATTTLLVAQRPRSALSVYGTGA